MAGPDGHGRDDQVKNVRPDEERNTQAELANCNDVAVDKVMLTPAGTRCPLVSASRGHQLCLSMGEPRSEDTVYVRSGDLTPRAGENPVEDGRNSPGRRHPRATPLQEPAS